MDENVCPVRTWPTGNELAGSQGLPASWDTVYIQAGPARWFLPWTLFVFCYLYNLTSSQPVCGSACVLLPRVTTGDSPRSVSLHIPMSCTQPPGVFLGLVGSQTHILEPLGLSPNTSSSKICISKQWFRLWNLHTEVHVIVFMYRGKYFDLCLCIII